MLNGTLATLRNEENLAAKILGFLVFSLFAVLSVVALATVLTGCPSGTKLAVSASGSCSEHAVKSGEAPPPADLVNLDCPELGGSGTVGVTLPRTQWAAMQAPNKYLPDGGAGQKEPVGK